MVTKEERKKLLCHSKSSRIETGSGGQCRHVTPADLNIIFLENKEKQLHKNEKLELWFKWKHPVQYLGLPYILECPTGSKVRQETGSKHHIKPSFFKLFFLLLFFSET